MSMARYRAAIVRSWLQHERLVVCRNHTPVCGPGHEYALNHPLSGWLHGMCHQGRSVSTPHRIFPGFRQVHLVEYLAQVREARADVEPGLLPARSDAGTFRRVEFSTYLRSIRCFSARDYTTLLQSYSTLCCARGGTTCSTVVLPELSMSSPPKRCCKLVVRSWPQVSTRAANELITPANVGGLRYAADDIEHGILRRNRPHPFLRLRPLGSGDPRLQFMVSTFDPRLHFALVCAAKSYPPIALYSGEQLDQQLNLAMRSFLRGGGLNEERNSGYFSSREYSNGIWEIWRKARSAELAIALSGGRTGQRQDLEDPIQTV